MKQKGQFLIWMVLLLFVLEVRGQTRKDVKLFAYARPVTGGVPKRITTSENHLLSHVLPHQGYTFLIYLQGPRNQRIYPVHMYLRGKRTGLRFSPVAETPVVISTSEVPQYAKTITLVPRTRDRVYILELAPETVKKTIKTGASRAAANDVVVVYRLSGKWYYVAQKRLELLPPVVLQ